MGPEGGNLTENMSYGRYSAGLHRPSHLAAIGGILVFSGLTVNSPELNSVDFSICSILQPKGQAMPHANLAALRPFITAEWEPASGVINPQDLLLFPPPLLSRC